jgi:hypothetical protein
MSGGLCSTAASRGFPAQFMTTVQEAISMLSKDSTSK